VTLSFDSSKLVRTTAQDIDVFAFDNRKIEKVLSLATVLLLLAFVTLIVENKSASGP